MKQKQKNRLVIAVLLVLVLASISSTRLPLSTTCPSPNAIVGAAAGCTTTTTFTSNGLPAFKLGTYGIYWMPTSSSSPLVTSDTRDTLNVYYAGSGTSFQLDSCILGGQICQNGNANPGTPIGTFTNGLNSSGIGVMTGTFSASAGHTYWIQANIYAGGVVYWQNYYVTFNSLAWSVLFTVNGYTPTSYGPLNGATITEYSPSGIAGPVLTTVNNGQVTGNFYTAGTWKLVVSYPGYVTQTNYFDPSQAGGFYQVTLSTSSGGQTTSTTSASSSSTTTSSFQQMTSTTTATSTATSTVTSGGSTYTTIYPTTTTRTSVLSSSSSTSTPSGGLLLPSGDALYSVVAAVAIVAVYFITRKRK